jgi:hypothetical protein
MPSKCELVHNHAHSFQNGAGLRSPAFGCWRTPRMRHTLVSMSTTPKHEPELRRAKGRAYAARCNKIANNYDSKTIYQALELSEQAHEVLGLPYAAGLSNLKEFPPSRFEWTCEQARGTVSIKLRDKHSCAVRNWPHWAG